MAQWLNWGKGTSGSPNSISGTINTYATCTGTAGQTSLTTALSASAGDQILIHQTQGTGAGTWEICEVVSDAGATLNLKTALVNSYGTGAQAVLIPQYTGGTISGAVTGTAWNGSVGGIIALISNGDLTVSGSITAPAGFIGGAGTDAYPGASYQGGGLTGNGVASTNANGIGGGGAYNISSPTTASGGGGGGNATSGVTGGAGVGSTPGTGGGTGGNEGLTTAIFGGAGGGGSLSSTGKGGNSSGIIFIFSKNITISGTITCNGSSGQTGTGAKGSGGGGGAGGSCLIKCQNATLGSNKITANYGAGGGGVGGSGNGGNGGVGRIHLDYGISYTGTTNPTLDVALDNTLSSPSSGFFNFF